MKLITIAWATLLGMALFTGTLTAAESAAQKAIKDVVAKDSAAKKGSPIVDEPLKAVAKPAPKSWWSDFSVSPFGTVVHPNFGAPIYGAGLDVGYYINHTVSIHLQNVVYDGDGTCKTEGGWADAPAIDETSFLFRADLIRSSKERFVAYFLGSGSRDWVDHDWAFGAGAGAEIRLSKNFSVGAQSQVRGWFEKEKDVRTDGYLSLRF